MHRKVEGKQFSESYGGKGKIGYLGGRCLSSVRKLRVRRCMANVYNYLTNERNKKTSLLQFLRTTSHKT